MLLTLPTKTQETFKIPQCVDIGHTFRVNPRKPPYSKRSPGDIKYIVIHHSCSTGTLESENSWHVDHNNWYKLSYHICIDRGRIAQINDLLDITPHAMGANDHGIGVCVNWDLRKRGLTEFEQNALNGVVITLKEMFPNADIVGHNEISKRLANHITECPVIKMDKVRSDIMTAGLKIELSDTPNDQLAKAVALRARVEDIYKVASVPGKYQAEGLRKLAIIAEMMKEQGLL